MIVVKIPKNCPLCGVDMRTVSPLLHALEHRKEQRKKG